jgi:hypothetical protein
MNPSALAVAPRFFWESTAIAFVGKASRGLLQYSLGDRGILTSCLALHARIGNHLSDDDREDALPNDSLAG